MSEIFMLDNNLGILYGIGVDNRQHLEDHHASIARPDPRNHGGLRAPLHSPSLASRSGPDCGETQRQWSDRAIGRTTPCLFGLFSVVTLMAIRLSAQKQLPVAQTAWYRKEQATFSDVIAFVRRNLWAARYSVDSLSQTQSTEFNLNRLNQLLDCLSEAA